MKTITNSNLGYLFHPGQSQFGDGQLDVMLRMEPTQEHFDPERVHVVVGAPRGVQSLDIHHPWRLAKQYQVCAGHIRISDRYKKSINVFLFGGQVEITAVADYTICQFTSPAPLLELTDGSTVTLMLANGVDVLLAEQRARLNLRNAGDFGSKLIAVRPFLLYTSCLNTIHAKFDHIHFLSDSIQRRFKHELKLEIARLKHENNWPSSIQTLSELVGN